MTRSANDMNSPLSTPDVTTLVLERRLPVRRPPENVDLAPPPPDSPGAINIYDEDVLHATLRILYRRRWFAAAVFLATTSLGIAYLLSATPTYEGVVRLLIQPDNPNVVAFKDVVDQDRSAVEYYQTQYTILQSRSLARRTIDSLNLWGHPEFAGTGPSRWEWITELVDAASAPTTTTTSQSVPVSDADSQPADHVPAVGRFLSHLTVEPVKNSRLVDVHFQSSDPSIAARVANALAQTYIAQNLDIRVQAAKEALTWLEERLAEQRKKVEANDEDLQRYREHNQATSLEDKQNIVVQKLTDLSAAATRARTTRIEKQMLYEQSVALQNSKALDTFPAVLTNTPIQALMLQLAELQRQQAQLAERVGERHPEMIKLVSSIQHVQATLKTELDKAVEIVRNDYMLAQAQERSLAAELDAQKKLSLEVDRKSMDYSTLQRNAITDRGVFDTLLQRAKEIGIAGELKSGNVRILDEADVPRKPIWPDKRRGVPILVVASACLAIIAAFGVERLDRRIKSPEAIKLELGLPLLGLVPKIRTRRKRSATTLIDGGAPAHFLEAFGNLRATVLLAPGHHTGSVIVVASAGPREGKTLVASNLAVAVAQAGQRVLLVDVDLRCPKVHEVFNHPLTPGLAESLAGTVQAKMTIRPTLVPGLSVLPAGAHSGNPGATLASAEFKACIAALSREFDLIVLDSPPVLAVGDAVVVAAEASGLVFVVSAASTRRQTAMAALQRLDATGVPLLGVVLNQVDVEGHPYYYDPYYRREYKSYYVRSTGVTEHQDKGSWT